MREGAKSKEMNKTNYETTFKFNDVRLNTYQ